MVNVKHRIIIIYVSISACSFLFNSYITQKYMPNIATKKVIAIFSKTKVQIKATQTLLKDDSSYLIGYAQHRTTIDDMASTLRGGVSI